MIRYVSNALFFSLLVACGAVVVAPAQENRQAAKTASATSAAAGFRAEFLRQFEDAEKKLVALSEVVPQEKYSWRPADGVRSISEVFMHVAGGNYLIMQATGAKPPVGLDPEMEKITDRAKVVDSLKRSFEYVRAAALSTPDPDLDKSVNLFGRNTTVRDVYLLLAVHAHEHLGQSIAYARMNGIIPPWTAARQAQPRQERPR